MSKLNPFKFSAEDKEVLRGQLMKFDEVTSFSAFPKLAAKIASLGIQREIGTVNDELARFIFDVASQKPVERNSLRGELVTLNNLVGVRVFSTESTRLEFRAKHFRQLLHPNFSFNHDGTIKELVIFPEIIAKIMEREGIELVIVKSWAFNSIFGGFDPTKDYYQTNFWELENNDTLKFANLVAHHKLALLGTHDLIAHVAGANHKSWLTLTRQAQEVYSVISNYFASTLQPTIASLIIPYTAGVVLDDLAQPPTYGSYHHEIVLNELLNSMRKKRVPPQLPTILKEFPHSFKKIIEASRNEQTDYETAKRLIANLESEILQNSIRKHA